MSPVKKILAPITQAAIGSPFSIQLPALLAVHYEPRLRNPRCNWETATVSRPPISPLSLYRLEIAVPRLQFMQTRKLDRILGTTVSDRKRDQRFILRPVAFDSKLPAILGSTDVSGRSRMPTEPPYNLSRNRDADYSQYESASVAQSELSSSISSDPRNCFHSASIVFRWGCRYPGSRAPSC